MHLILALSVIILHHVDSFSCRSITSKLDDLHVNSAEDSTDSYELKQDDIVKLLHPFVKSAQSETPKQLTFQKNLARLTIEPYLETNQTHQWQRNPYGSFNKRKTIAPLAIILAHLPGLNSKKAQGNMQKKDYLVDKTENNDLNSRVGSEKTPFQPVKPNSYKQSSKEVIIMNKNEEDEIFSDSEISRQESSKTDFVDNKTKIPKISETSAKFVTKSQDGVSTDDQSSSDRYKVERQEDYTEVHSKITQKSDEIMNEGSTIKSKKTLEAAENNRDETALHDFPIDITDLNYKDKTADDKIQHKYIFISPEERSSIAQDREQIRVLNRQDQDIEVQMKTDEDNIRDISESVIENLTAANPRSENGATILDIRNLDKMNEESEKPESREDVTKDSLTYHLIPINNFQKNIDLESHEERNGGGAIAISDFTQQDHLRSEEDQIKLASGEKSSKISEDSYENHSKNPYSLEEYSYRQDKNIIEDLEQNALISSVKHAFDEPQHTVSDIDNDVNNVRSTEDSLKLHEKDLHKSEKEHEGLKHWHHDVHDWHRLHPNNVYNLCFHFNR